MTNKMEGKQVKLPFDSFVLSVIALYLQPKELDSFSRCCHHFRNAVSVSHPLFKWYNTITQFMFDQIEPNLSPRQRAKTVDEPPRKRPRVAHNNRTSGSMIVLDYLNRLMQAREMNVKYCDENVIKSGSLRIISWESVWYFGQEAINMQAEVKNGSYIATLFASKLTQSDYRYSHMSSTKTRFKVLVLTSDVGIADQMDLECNKWCELIVGSFTSYKLGTFLSIFNIARSDLMHCLRTILSVGLTPTDSNEKPPRESHVYDHDSVQMIETLTRDLLHSNLESYMAACNLPSSFWINYIHNLQIQAMLNDPLNNFCEFYDENRDKFSAVVQTNTLTLTSGKWVMIVGTESTPTTYFNANIRIKSELEAIISLSCFVSTTGDRHFNMQITVESDPNSLLNNVSRGRSTPVIEPVRTHCKTQVTTSILEGIGKDKLFKAFKPTDYLSVFQVLFSFALNNVPKHHFNGCPIALPPDILPAFSEGYLEYLTADHITKSPY